MRAWASLATLAAALFGMGVTTSCQDLEPIETGCGNAVVEVGEDCDGNFASSEFSCGAPDDTHECRYVCNATLACPPEFTCDVDGEVCRKPRGLFQQVGESLPGSTQPLVVADLDRDGTGRDELIVTRPSTLTTLYFDDAHQVQLADELTVRSRDEAVGAYLDDQSEELALLIEGSGDDVRGYLALLQTQTTSGGYLPLPFASVTLGFPELTAESRFATVDTYFGETITRIDSSGIAVLTPEFEARQVYGSAAIPLGNAFAGIAFGNPVPDSTACDFAAVAREEAPRVTLFPLCTFDNPASPDPEQPELQQPGNGPPPFIEIELPFGATVAKATGSENAIVQSRVRFGDVNGDDIDDLVVQGDCDGFSCYLLALGLGQAELGPGGPAVLRSPDEMSAERNVVEDILAATDDDACTVSGFVEGQLLAIADFNDDNLADLVTNEGVFLSEGQRFVEGLYTIDYEQAICVGRPDDPLSGYREAEVEDINADGTVDLVVRESRGGMGKEGSLAVLLNDGDGFFGEYPIADRSSFFEIEDLDGDGLDDVITYARIESEMSAVYEGFVSFGRASAGPEPLIDIGEFEGVTDLIAGRFLGNDAPSDSLIVKEKDGVIETAILLGSTSRLLVAPFLFLEPGTVDPAQAERPITMATGRFGGARPSLAVITESWEDDTDFALWHLELGESTVAQGALDRFDVQAEGAELNLDDALAVALDINDDGRDELIVATPEGVAAFVIDGQTGGPIGAWRYETGGEVSRLTGRPLVTDLDGDGGDDLVIALGTDDARIVWNQEELDLAGATPVPVPTSDGGRSELPVFAALDLDGVPPIDLVLANDTGVWRVPLEGRAALPPVRLPQLDGGNTLAAADFNGDGLVDLAVGDASTTRIYAAQDSPGLGALEAALTAATSVEDP